MSVLNHSNIAVDTDLDGGITAVATSLTVTSATGYPDAPFAIQIVDAADETVYEVIKVGTKSGTTFSDLVRGYDGTTAAAWSDADLVYHVVIAEDIATRANHSILTFKATESTTTSGTVARTLVTLDCGTPPSGLYRIDSKHWRDTSGNGRTNLDWSDDGGSTWTTLETTGTHRLPDSYEDMWGWVDYDNSNGELHFRQRYAPDSAANMQYGLSSDERWQHLLVATGPHRIPGATLVYDLLHSKKPAADTPDDEFEGTALDAKWTAVSGTSGTVSLLETGEVEKYDLTTRPGWLLLQAGSAADQKVELRQDFTIPDGSSMVAAMSFAWATSDGDSGIANNEQQFGIALNDTDSGYDAGAHINLSFETDVDGWRVRTYDGSTVLGSTNVSPAEALTAPGSVMFLRVARSGTTYRFYVAGDGSSWMNIGSKVIATAPTNFWIHVESVAASQDPVPIHAVAWVRQGTNALDPWDPTATVAIATNGWGDWQDVDGGVGFENFWVNFGSGAQDAEYRKHADGMVQLRGLVKSGTVNSAIFTLPAGYRPPAQSIFACLDGSDTHGVEANSTGTVVLRTGGNNGSVQLDPIMFDSTGGT